MDKEEIIKIFEENVEYLRRNIPPDDIYMFAEQTFMAAVFFLSQWGEHINLLEEMRKSSVARKYVQNIIGLKTAKERKIDLHVDLDLDRMTEE